MAPRLDLPCLAFHSYGGSTTILSLSGENKRVAIGAAADEILSNKVICPTAQGLLLVRDPNTMATFFWSPASGEKVPLPPLRGVDDAVLVDSHCLLSGEPAATGCVVLLVEGWNDTFIWYCRPGDDAWGKHEYDIGSRVLRWPGEEEDRVEKHVICSIAACRGKFYFDYTASDLRVIDLGGEEPAFTAIAVDDTVTADGSYGVDERHPCRIFLVESDGELYMVRLLFVSPYVDRIDRASVHRMDFSERRWRKVRDLGGRAFMPSSFYFGASCSGGDEHGLLQDRVYFLFGRDNTLQVFDVPEGTYQLHKLDEAPEMHKAFWLLPID